MHLWPSSERRYRSLNRERRTGVLGTPGLHGLYRYKKAKPVQFPNLKPSSRAISIRLPESLIENIKVLANREDVPYQSMMKVLLAEKVTEALRSPKRKKTAA